jgi:hypothetical protein
MQPVTDPVQLQRYRNLVVEMTVQREQEECEFDPEWVRTQGWKVVPVESAARIPPADIPRLVGVLSGLGCKRCVVVATEPLGDMPNCYLLSVQESELRELNRVLGVFRFMLTDENRSWAISCNEWYNLFGSTPELLEKLLGKPIEEARAEYLRFASELAHSSDEPLLRVAKHYASL